MNMFLQSQNSLQPQPLSLRLPHEAGGSLACAEVHGAARAGGGVPWAGEEAKEQWCSCCSQATPTVPGTGGGQRAFPAPGPVQGNKQLWAMMTGPL